MSIFPQTSGDFASYFGELGEFIYLFALLVAFFFTINTGPLGPIIQAVIAAVSFVAGVNTAFVLMRLSVVFLAVTRRIISFFRNLLPF